ncbi:hypothetical protein PAPYR_10743 [Paratrimastix pyriformis]|uniref:Ubiquitin carboxyl-terminal hydrolase 7 ICP0-binding domain-containing protein n=1 Tax=Paratrimastix pyriformis TaxID=342808 RepID=A0ABQ8UAZ0_9EUKA|nr:hypothetical protein PAPYR_10743 [Paratrimastix pyriformis]
MSPVSICRLCLYVACVYMSSADGPLPPVTSENLLVFFKRYDPRSHMTQYLGKSYPLRAITLAQLLPQLQEMAGWHGVPLSFYLESGPTQLTALSPEVPLAALLEENGMTVIMEPTPAPGAQTVLEYYRQMANKATVVFRDLTRPKARSRSSCYSPIANSFPVFNPVDAFTLELPRSLPCPEVVVACAEQLKAPPERVQLWRHRLSV